MTNETHVCQNCEASFVIDASDFAFYDKIQVPAPTFCPRCRMQRRMAFRNERFLYKRKSDFSGKEIFSMYPTEAPLRVYENDVWFSDKWDPMTYGRDIDFSRPFFEQLLKLYREVPVYALSTIYGVNSDYANNYTSFKNCYLAFHGNYAEDCMYGTGLNYSKNCVDNVEVDKCENCYENFFIKSSENVFYSAQCSDSFNLYLCKNCAGCNDCFGCANLRNKKYHIFNKPYSRDEYAKKLLDFNLGSHESLARVWREAREFWSRFPVKYMQGVRNTNVTGEYIYNSKNVRDSYIVKDGESLRYCSNIQTGPAKDCYDYTVWGDKAELVYESEAVGLGAHNVRFCQECWPEMMNTEYSLCCQSSSDIFGCVGVKNKKHCILNKQYSIEEYNMLREKVIEHMNAMPYRDSRGIIYRYGEFFPPAFSPVPYNHSLAHEHFPLGSKEAEGWGYTWRGSEERSYTPTKKPAELPDNICNAPDSITDDVVLCAAWEEDSEKARGHNCTMVFRIIPQELEFYRRFNIPLPRKCYNSRHAERIGQRNSLWLWCRTCSCGGVRSRNGAYVNAASHIHGIQPCPNEFETSYSPDRPEIVYCESCYNSEVV